MDSTLSLCASIFVGKANESSLSLEGISEPLSLVSLELKVLEGNTLVLWDWDSVLSITN